ncbi:MAG: SpoIIE family protein phosphatase [Candidatus Acidiferrales bacterium]
MTDAVRSSQEEMKNMAQVSDPYIRAQLEKRREELTVALSAATPAVPTAPFLELLNEVDTAIHEMEVGTYGICKECHDPIERERLIADPLVKVCIDHLTTSDRRALEADLELAARVQRGLLPEKHVRFGDWHVHYEYKAAGAVSGDYCDLILPRERDGSMLFLLGDVAGKGVAASLLMTHMHAMFRSLSNGGSGDVLGLDKLLETANRVFCESTFAGQYATLVCGCAGRAGQLDIASAGHLPALLVKRDGVRQIGATGLPLGMFSSSRYAVQRARLDPGDCLLLYTDGISEAHNAAGKEYGVNRLSTVAGERHRWVPQELLAACMKDVEGYGAGARLADDQTMMVIHRNEGVGHSVND